MVEQIPLKDMVGGSSPSGRNYYMGILIQIVGWIGAFLIVLAYFLVSYKKVQADSRLYQVMNLAGAMGVGVNALYQEAWPSFGLQIVWGIIAITALVKR